ncbi:DUF6515 family protein [Brumimicrobium aurantiacum]|uniref:Orphan protein n=1 Tax=Brumimicrobium aurantiacum TaxID=1737063 RepID=A0A3E1F0E1_9FLAO|nr:DUF6515 family protein [Brumimicrobium aurantiacum]RFC55270.1 hypothetical protein DXU93_05465 [Brumimicrobium aurantiacum]
MMNLIKACAFATLIIVGFTTSAMAQPNHKPKKVKVVKQSQVKYKKPTRKVVSVRTLPKKTVIVHKGHNYYYANNRFYTQSRGHYIRIAPKVGFKIIVLPSNYRKVHYNNRDYFVVNGIFFKQSQSQYEVVNPEIGTIIYELPDEYEKVEIDGITYYEYANVLYEKIQVDVTRAYEVVGMIEIE